MIRRVLTDPKVIFGSTVCGALLGAFIPTAGLVLKPLGDLYIAALSICIVPLMMTALIGGIGRMLRNPSLRSTFPRFAIVYLATLLVPGVIAVAIGLLLQPGANLSAEAVASLGQRLSSDSLSQATSGLSDLLIAIIPSNIFLALSAQNFAAIVIFSLLLGLGLGVVEGPAGDSALNVVQPLYKAFSRIFEWILTPLAIGLFCLIAGVAATVDTTIFVSLISYVAAFYCAGLTLFVFYTLLLVLLRRVKSIRSLGGLRQPLTISFLTNNPFIAIRPAIDALIKRLGVEDEVADAVLPFGIIASQHGQIINIILLTMFLANLYGIDLSAMQIATLMIGGIIGGAAVVGGGAALAPALAPVLGSVGVPGDLGIVVLATTEQIVGPMISLLTVYTASTLVLLGRRASGPAKTAGPIAESEVTER